jgi:hypothetical protein
MDPGRDAPPLARSQWLAASAALCAASGDGTYWDVGERAAKAAAWAAAGLVKRVFAEEYRVQSAYLRDLAGHPNEAVLIMKRWLAWGEGTALKVGQAIYEGHRFADLPVLADALEDAGCEDDTLLGHLRRKGPHIRGCWALDLLLGKG